MDAKLNLDIHLKAYVDPRVSSNPRLRPVDWARSMSSVSVVDPQTSLYTLNVGETKTIFDGTRSTSIDGTTAFNVTLSPLSPSRYRFTHSAGTAPNFRTSRGLTLSGIAVTFVVNANATVNVSVPNLSAFDFTTVSVGDIVYIPNVSTGDIANVISEANSGYWQVLSKLSNINIVLNRLSGVDFNGSNETVTLTSNSQLSAFTANGVQVGDHVEIAAGFAAANRKNLEIVAVTDSFFEVISTSPMAVESGVLPGANGLLFYTDNKIFLYIESDQELTVRANGDTGSTQRVTPFAAGDATLPGVYTKSGAVWSLVLVNRSTSVANVFVVDAE